MAEDVKTLISAVELTRVFDAPISRVYEAWTSADAIKAWFGPPSCKVLSADWDPAAGRSFRIEVSTDEMGDMAAIGTFREIETGKKIVMDWNWEGDSQDYQSRLCVSFREVDGGTELRLVHDGFAQKESRDNHEGGWLGTLEKLATFLA